MPTAELTAPLYRRPPNLVTSGSRELIDRGIMTKDEVSMRPIRQWMQANPDEAKQAEQQNRAYVFFRVADLSNNDEPIGVERVPLVPVVDAASGDEQAAEAQRAPQQKRRLDPASSSAPAANPQRRRNR